MLFLFKYRNVHIVQVPFIYLLAKPSICLDYFKLPKERTMCCEVAVIL